MVVVRKNGIFTHDTLFLWLLVRENGVFTHEVFIVGY